MKKAIFLFLIISFTLFQCTKTDKYSINENGESAMIINKKTIDKAINELTEKFGADNKFRIEKGVNQAAALWQKNDGTKEEFKEFCLNNFISDDNEVDKVFNRLSDNFEILWGHFNKINLDLKKPTDMSSYEELPIDKLFAAYSPTAHIADDFFKNKIAFTILLNFPHYSLKEKTELGKNWSRKDWAYVRMGDLFVSRIPGDLLQKQSDAVTNADAYISKYNIYMGFLVDENGKTFFPSDLMLISHWGLRDELKSHYADNEGGFEKQQLIYEVMKNIISQSIPECVINSKEYTWNPTQNKVFKNGNEIEFKTEPDTRYEHIINNFKAVKSVDIYSPSYPTYINRKFDEEFEIPQETVEKLFTGFVSSTQVKDVAKIIEKRLGRKLEPFDIWYDGFKARSSISESDLNQATMKKYPTPEALKKDLPDILVKLGFNHTKSSEISSKIEVDPSRGAGHAWGAQMKSDNAHLRTRIGKDGMNYKGYNIAVHEFGHNVEQTLTLHDVDYYMLTGVPNTAFTEAWAFVFQKRDLELLGIKENNPDKKTMMVLDNFWSTYEIMGVSLVDMNLWKWLYEHPEAKPKEVKDATIEIAKDIWNRYYAGVFGIKDQPILAIYSHMIDYPLYLSAYPLGHLIEFQMESYMDGKNLAEEMIRICKQGRITPQYWMLGAVGNELSIQPTLEATQKAIEKCSK
ncbi:hypothetical protein ACFLSQ_09720 [Bacteroidota bacterium]